MLELTKHERFSKHATYFIQMIDKALGMLGPDIELLTEILMDLGLKHAKVRILAIISTAKSKQLCPVAGESLTCWFSFFYLNVRSMESSLNISHRWGVR